MATTEQSRGNRVFLHTLPAEGAEPLGPALLFNGETSKCSRVLHVLASHEPSLYFEVFKDSGVGGNRKEAPRYCVFSV